MNSTKQIKKIDSNEVVAALEEHIELISATSMQLSETRNKKIVHKQNSIVLHWTQKD